MRTRVALRFAALILAAIAAALVPLPRAFIERWYSSFLYVHLQHAVTRVSNVVPFALFDALIVAVLAAWFLLAIADFRHGRLSLVRLVIRTATWTAVLYLAFLLVWGLNYRRMPLMDKLQFDPQAARRKPFWRWPTRRSIDSARCMIRLTRWAGRRLVPSNPPWRKRFGRVQRELGNEHAFVPARPKRTLLNPLFRLSGVEGMTDPYFLETLLESGMLPFERAAAIAHEWGHLAGFADESEASFVGWLACLHGSTADQYSGWLFLIEELIPAVPQQDRRGFIGRIATGAARGLARHRRAPAHPGESGCLQRQRTNLRSISQSQSCRGGNRQLR